VVVKVRREILFLDPLEPFVSRRFKPWEEARIWVIVVVVAARTVVVRLISAGVYRLGASAPNLHKYAITIGGGGDGGGGGGGQC
jgi:hypothetical protein